jgi:ankyrin repeat protein
MLTFPPNQKQLDMKRIIMLALSWGLAFAGTGQTLSKAIEDGNLGKVKDELAVHPEWLNQKDPGGLTPLNKAAAEKQTDIALELIRMGADPAIGDNENTLPLHHAALTGNIELFKILCKKKGDVNLRDDNGVTPLHYSIQGKYPAMTQYLVEAGADVNALTARKWSPLLYTAIFGPVETAQVLIKTGADVNVKNNTGLTPLHSATSFGRTGIVKLLVENGATIDAQDEHGDTPLFLARNPDTYDAVKYLLEKGANARHKNHFGRTPLMAAAGRGSAGIVELYLERGVDINAIDSNGWTALHMTSWARDPDAISKYLILHGAEVNPVFCKHDRQHDCCNGVTTPLHAAASSGQQALVRNLVSNGAKVNVLDQNGLTPLFLAVKKGNPDVVRYLVEHGAFLNVAEQTLGTTELMLAVALGNKDIADYLIRNGADVNQKNKEGKNAADMAWYYGHKQIGYALLNSGGSDNGLAPALTQPSPLSTSLNEKEAMVWFLGHSGWAIKTKNHLLIFDYAMNPMETPPPDSSLANGYVNPQELKDLDVTVLASHSHGDHYNRNIFGWQKEIPKIGYVLCFRPQDATGEYTYIPVHGEQEVNGMKISVIKSTDLDGGYLVEVDGLAILHPGDLANGEDRLMKAYTDEIDRLAARNKKIDIAFAPIRGCSLGSPEQVKSGIEYMLEKLRPALFVPMHAGSATLDYKRFADELKGYEKTTTIRYVVNRGDRFMFGSKAEMVGCR